MKEVTLNAGWGIRYLGVIVLWMALPVHGQAVSSPSNDLALARIALADGLHDVAELRARAVLEETNAVDRAAALPILLESLAAQSRTNALAEALVSGLVPEGGDAMLYWQARLAWAKNDGAGVLELLAGFETQYPDSPYKARALRVRSMAALGAGDVAAALLDMEAYDRCDVPSVEKARNRLDWGQALVAAGDPVAGEALLASLKHEPGAIGRTALYWWAKTAATIPAKAAEAKQALVQISGDASYADTLRAGATLKLADAATAAGNHTGAVAMIRTCLDAIPTGDEPVRLDLSRALAAARLESGELARAAELVKTVVMADAESKASGDLLLELAARQLDTGEAALALASYQAYLETFAFPDGAALATAGRAAALMAMGKHAQAAADFERAIGMFTDPDRQQACTLKAGEALAANGQSGLAAAHFKSLLETWPACPYVPRALYLLGVGAAQRGELDAATEFFSKVVAQFPNDPEAEEALLRLARLHEDRSDWESAERVYDSLLEQYPKGRFVPLALYGRGRARYQARRPGALADLERVTREFGDHEVAEKAAFLQAICLYRLGRNEEALAVCSSYRERFPHSPWAPRVHFWIGKFLFNEGRYEEAEAQFQRFVEEFPEDAMADDAMLRAGMSAARRRDFVRANELFGALATKYPESDRLADARFYQGDTLSQLAEFGAAILAFDEVINKFPESDLVGLAWGRKGDCQFTLGATEPSRYEESMTSYRVVTQIPTTPLDLRLQADYKIGRCLEKTGKPAAALDQYYTRVMIPFLNARDAGKPITESSKLWFVRASMRAADYLEAQGEWHQMARVLERVASAGVSTSAEARERARRVRQEHWWDFL